MSISDHFLSFYLLILPYLSDGRKTHQTIPKAHLHLIPAFEDPFSRLIIDCVGALPKTKSGHECLLTTMCVPTLSQEAIPLKNIKNKNIVKALINCFTFVGLFSRIRAQISCIEFFSRSCMSWAILSIQGHLTILKIKVP